MKAAILNQYNKKDVNLSFSNLPTPSISADQVLVKSLAAGVNHDYQRRSQTDHPLPSANRSW